jgi:HSP20 family protein
MPYVSIRRGYDPFRELEKFEKEFFATDRAYGFRTDVKELEDRFILEAELPGFKKDEINVEVHEGKLTISAERSKESCETDGAFIHKERTSGTYMRSFDLSLVDEAEIKASYTDGILTLVLPKKKEEVPQKRKLEIE